jgi:hypothetical protein
VDVGDRITISAETQYQNVRLTVSGERLELVAENRIVDESNNFVVTVRVIDEGGLTSDTSFNVRMIRTNTAPIITQIEDQTIVEKEKLTLNLIVVDNEQPNGLTYDISNTNNSGALKSVSLTNTNTEIEIEAIEQVETEVTETITVTVTDGIETTTMSFNVTIQNVEEVPVTEEVNIIILENVSGNELREITLVGIDEDPNSLLTYSIVENPRKGSIEEISGNVVTYKALKEYHGLDYFLYRATDETGLKSNISRVNITITQVINTPEELLSISGESLDNLLISPYELTIQEVISGMIKRKL